MKRLFALAIALPLAAVVSAAGAENGADQAGVQRTNSTGHGVREDAREAKQGIKRTARGVKYGVKSGAQEVGHGIRAGAREVKRAIKDVFR